MNLLRVSFGVLCLAAAAFSAFLAYNAWRIMCFCAGMGWRGANSLNFFGISLPFSTGMTLLVGSTLLFGVAAVWALFSSHPPPSYAAR